jgi:hypothetical protein
MTPIPASISAAAGSCFFDHGAGFRLLDWGNRNVQRISLLNKAGVK